MLSIPTEKGTYAIKAKAKDINGSQSEWSDPIEINVPRNTNAKSLLILRIFKLFPFLNFLLKLLNFKENYFN